jgi:hypothetical protein
VQVIALQVPQFKTLPQPSDQLPQVFPKDEQVAGTQQLQFELQSPEEHFELF